MLADKARVLTFFALFVHKASIQDTSYYKL
jgi:hypothetical protein